MLHFVHKFSTLKTGHVAQSISIQVPGNTDNMHHGVHTIGSNWPMLRQENGGMEIRVELGAGDYSLLGKLTCLCSN